MIAANFTAVVNTFYPLFSGAVEASGTGTLAPLQCRNGGQAEGNFMLILEFRVGFEFTP